MNIPSKHLNRAVEQMSSLSGIGQKTALRLILDLLKKENIHITQFAEAIEGLATNLKQCSICFNYSDEEVCTICASPSRNTKCVCVVEDIRDVLAIESSGQYGGVYHVLGGVLNPVEGIGPNELTISGLVDRCNSGEVDELILALGSTIEGDTTSFYIYKQVNNNVEKITSLSRGVSVGSELHYTDEVTLSSSLVNRKPFEGKF